MVLVLLQAAIRGSFPDSITPSHWDQRPSLWPAGEPFTGTVPPQDGTVPVERTVPVSDILAVFARHEHAAL